MKNKLMLSTLLAVTVAATGALAAQAETNTIEVKTAPVGTDVYVVQPAAVQAVRMENQTTTPDTLFQIGDSRYTYGSTNTLVEANGMTDVQSDQAVRMRNGDDVEVEVEYNKDGSVDVDIDD